MKSRRVRGSQYQPSRTKERATNIELPTKPPIFYDTLL